MNKQQLAALAKRKEMEYNDQLQDVRQLELKARFWKAQFEIRYFTLEAEKLQVPYDEYVALQREKNEKAMKEYQEMLAKISEDEKAKAENTTPHVVTEEDLRLNPEMVEAGVKVGDTIGIPTESDLTPEEEAKAHTDFLKEHPEYASNIITAN